MATRVFAQVLVAGATVLMRAGMQAWSKALVNAQKTGVANEAAKAATKSAVSKISSEEARMILQVDKEAPWGEVVKRYKHLYDVNEKHGSFYLVSKVYRAKERLEQDYEEDGRKAPEPEEPPTQQGQVEAGQSNQTPQSQDRS